MLSPSVPTTDQFHVAIEPTQVPLRLLVVDPEAETLQLTREVAAAEQFTVCTAGTLAESRRLLANNPPDIVLLDVALPNNSALILLGEIESQYPRTDVIVETGLT
ncbi:MAG TPA: response regulator, partial [Acidobacteriaceae bacterium]|nr:response regulator [Acidobacteriaceae bacterium]